MRLQGQSTPRPMTHDLMVDIFGELEVRCTQVVVTELRDNTFFATITLTTGTMDHQIDARPPMPSRSRSALAPRSTWRPRCSPNRRSSSSMRWRTPRRSSSGSRTSSTRSPGGLRRRRLVSGLTGRRRPVAPSRPVRTDDGRVTDADQPSESPLRRLSRGEIPPSGSFGPVLRTLGIVAAVFVALVMLLGLIGSAPLTRPEAGEIGVVRNGGPLDNRNIRGVVKSGSGITWAASSAPCTTTR